MKFKAFTLAEVLITLIIIGVVAALTIPSVVVKYEKEQTVTKLKKVYSTLMQANQKAIVENGPMNTWSFNSKKDFVDKYLRPYLSIQKDCGYGNCSFSFSYKVNNVPSEPISLSTAYYRIILNDGTMLGFLTYVDNANAYGFVYIDINGPKKPNITGRDVFVLRYFFFHNYYPADRSRNNFFTGIVPITSSRESLINSCANGNNSYNGYNLGCAELIIKDGWKISDDYPW